jgi:AcrR family transcriptional regulator
MSRTKSRPIRRSAARVARLSDELTSLFLTEGFLHLTTDEIARRLRCSKSTLYHVAPSREQLFATVVDRYLTRVREDGIAAADQSTSFPSAVTALLGAGVTAAREASWEFVRDMRRHPAAQRRLAAHQRQRVRDLERLLEAGVRNGAFHDLHPRMIAEILYVIIARVFEPDLLASVGLSLEQAYNEAYRMIEYGLLPRRRSHRARSDAIRRRPRSSEAMPWAELW